jgi:hypothetical protein
MVKNREETLTRGEENQGKESEKYPDKVGAVEPCMAQVSTPYYAWRTNRRYFALRGMWHFQSALNIPMQ